MRRLFVLWIGLVLCAPTFVAAQTPLLPRPVRAPGRLGEIQKAQEEALAAYSKAAREATTGARERAAKRSEDNKDRPEVEPQNGEQRVSRLVADKESVEQISAANAALTAASTKNAADAIAFARENPKDPNAFAALQWASRTSRSGTAQIDEAFQLMAQSHFAEPTAGTFCRTLYTYYFLPSAEKLIRTVAEKNPSREQRGLAWYGLGYYLQYQSKLVAQLKANEGVGKTLQGQISKEGIERLRALDLETIDKKTEEALVKASDEYGDLEIGAGKKRTLKELVAGQLFAVRNLKVGQPIPDIVGHDHEDNPFKLSDYKGKVLVLTFSGDWCPPCRAMYPHQRELVRRMKDKPFALLSVNTDAKKETLARSIEDGTITWRCWFDGGTAGPLSSAWGVTSFPSIFVIDHNGIIRSRDIRKEELDKAVDDLMARLPPAE